MTRDVDLFVIGGGSGGVRAARIAAGHGARVAIAEDRDFGGTCVVRGCIPKKLFVYAAEFAHRAEDAAAYGWRFDKSTFDWPTLVANKDKEVRRLSGLYRQTLEKNRVQIHDGRARLLDAHTIEVAGKRVTTDVVLIATGGRPSLPSVPGCELGISSDEAFHLPALPKRVTIVGGGYIGVEFASIFAGLGAKVTLIHRSEFVLRGFDLDVRGRLTEALERLGVEVRMSCEVLRLQKQGDGILVDCRNDASHAADAVLFATGRVPNTRDLGLEAVGVKLGERGEVEVDRFSQSSVKHVYAVGDCTDRMALTPVAIREGHAFADSVFGKTPTPIEHKNIPTAVFSRPPAAGVGLREDEAREQFANVDVYQTSFRPLFHTMTGRDEPVMMKLVVDGKTDRVLGAHMVGAGAADIIQIMTIAVVKGMTKRELDQIYALHPTTAEEIVLMRTKRE
jgi:glutathione reductase (NADPH)